MATYTTNYNLSKPDASDQFSAFRTSYNQNMDIIDQNLGGGGGGSSTLAGLNDVSITSAQDGQVLKYDANSSEWINANESSGGDTVSWTEVQQSGTKIAAIDINGTSTDVYAPTPPTKTSDLVNDSNFVSDASYVHTDNNFTSAYETKLGGIEAGAEVNVQSDWSQADNTADDYIKNKPTIPTTIGDLNDVTVSMPSSGEVLMYNGSMWENGTLAVPSDLDDLSDVTITTPTDGQVLKYDSNSGEWINANDSVGDTVTWNQIQATGTKIAEIDINGTTYDVYAPTGGGASSLSGLSDVTLTTPSNNQILRYNGSKWVNDGEKTSGVTPEFLAGTTKKIGTAWSLHNNSLTQLDLEAPLPEWNQYQNSGTLIADITIDGNTTNIYAPSGGDTVSWNQIQTNGTKIAEITINGSTVDVAVPDKVLTNQTLSFVGTTATLSVSGVTADTLIFVFFHDVTIASDAEIVADTGSGVITFTASSAPANTVVCDIIIKG